MEQQPPINLQPLLKPSEPMDLQLETYYEVKALRTLSLTLLLGFVLNTIAWFVVVLYLVM